MFEEADLASLPPPPSPAEEGAVEVSESTTPTQTTSSMMHLNITGIFRRKPKKKKKNVESGKVGIGIFLAYCCFCQVENYCIPIYTHKVQ